MDSVVSIFSIPESRRWMIYWRSWLSDGVSFDKEREREKERDRVNSLMDFEGGDDRRGGGGDGGGGGGGESRKG